MLLRLLSVTPHDICNPKGNFSFFIIDISLLLNHSPCEVKPYVTEEQVRVAKAVNTLSFLLHHQPERFKRVGRTEYAHYDHDSLKVGANGKWNWHSRA